MSDALDRLLAMAEPAEEQDRIALEPGISFWRSAGVTPSGGLRYSAALPAGLHVSAGRGEMQSLIAGETVHFSGPQFALFRMAAPTPCETTMAPGRRWRSLGLWIAPGWDDDIWAGAPSGSISERLQPRVPSQAVGALIASTAHQRYRGLARDYALRAQAYALLAALTDSRQHYHDSPADRRRVAVEAAQAIIDAEYADPPRLADLARQVGTNRRYLTADFRVRTGMSIAAYITARRLDHARDMLAGGLTPGQVAARVGLTPSHFAQAFRRRFGLPPSRHRPKLP